MSTAPYRLTSQTLRWDEYGIDSQTSEEKGAAYGEQTMSSRNRVIWKYLTVSSRTPRRHVFTLVSHGRIVVRLFPSSV
ncbi:hypothetical protein Baya_10773 [Bagarius yarrelli]|uniref:Uncharacterized protein n=1 Tax=Bagarius yarrelli TaxID=175774 RepID=A0A556UZB3_BAGYA|nr:hypothetical protein Baya_10773 [Bagarius yarrelli]